MKNFNLFVAMVFYLSFLQTQTLKATNIDSLFQVFVEETESELSALIKKQDSETIDLRKELEVIDLQLKDYSTIAEQDLNDVTYFLLRRYQLEQELEGMEAKYQIDISKIRFKKGIEMIKIIYEKILSLDHHFTSLQTYQNVATISNPNSFPEFQKIKGLLTNKLDKKQAIKMPALFDSNPFVSMTFSLVSSIFGSGEKEERQYNLDEISCILDFTVRMNADLNVIYYETEFLKSSNLALKKECIGLFKDYTKVIDYRIPLPECRQEDDWEEVFESLDLFAGNFAEEINNPQLAKGAYKRQTDLEFSIERLLLFLETYNNFINQGEKYYQKFLTIVNNYSNQAVCESKLPKQLEELKVDIETSISKFNEAYDISDLRGSKLKDLIYGDIQ